VIDLLLMQLQQQQLSQLRRELISFVTSRSMTDYIHCQLSHISIDICFVWTS